MDQPTQLLVPGDLAAQVRAVRRARRRRIALALAVVALMVAPPIALTWLARGTAIADGTITYPSRWANGRVELQDAEPPQGASSTGGLRRGDRVTAVNDHAVADWDGRGRLHPGPAFYTVSRSSVSSEVQVNLRGYPWGRALLHHAVVFPMVIVLWVVAAYVFLRRPREPAARALFAAAVVLPYTGLIVPFGTQVVDVYTGRLWPHVIGDVAYALLWGTMLHFALSFPRVVPWPPRAWCAVAAYAVPFAPWLAVTAWRVGRGELGASYAETTSWLVAISAPAVYLMAPLVVAVVSWQYVRCEDPVERRALRRLTNTVVVTVLIYLAFFTLPERLGTPLLTYDWVAVLFLGIPLVLGGSVLRDGAFDVQVRVSKSLVDTSVAVILGLPPALVLLVVALRTGHRPWDLRDPWSLCLVEAAALLAVLLLMLVGGRLRRLLGGMLFGSRHDPYGVLVMLGEPVGPAAPDETRLVAMARTVARTLRLPYVGVQLQLPDGSTEIHEVGRAETAVQAVPLTGPLPEGPAAGLLLLGSRPHGEPFGVADRELLVLLAHQVALAARDVLLTRQLQLALGRTVAAREEERRRLRRDIHDGLGPMLISARMRLELAAAQVGRDPEEATVLLRDVLRIQGLVIDDVRRILEDLRPAVLDDGLVAALRAQCEAFTGSAGPLGPNGGLRLTVDAPADLGPLPASVEVAAYRIAAEAVTNVVRHAGATRCQVRLRRSDSLEVDVTDNGRGFAEERTPSAPAGQGVGLQSMRDRAAEVGGWCTITSQRDRGTTVLAHLPISSLPR